MSVINTNVKSLVAQNALTVNNRAMSKTMEQLSTGKRINTAADDAAGLAISSKMTSQIKGLNQAVRNANDGISMLQTVEGATVEMTNMLQRMRELAVQSANDTNTTEDRGYLNDEFQQLSSEINRIASQTTWNGEALLNGRGAIKFQVGADENQTIDITLSDFRTVNSAASEVHYLNFSASDVVATDKFTMTIGGNTTVSVALDAAKAAFFDKDTVNTTNAADYLQTELRKNSSLVDIKVTADGKGNIKIEDPQGRELTAIKLVTTADAALTVATTTGEVQDGTPSAAVNTTAVFGASAAVETSAAVNSQSITTRQGANDAVVALDNALKNVNSERSKMGAVINRLTYAADNLTNVSQNTSASRSRILDADYASSTTELARTQIISQAATAMLAQANQAPQSVLSLLR
jgi:flagellin